jgi:threonine dehydrogenase-like Zn-dependent dehydrogenase
MKALVWHGEGDIRLDTVDDPTILDPNDAALRITRSAICGTDLHFIRGTTRLVQALDQNADVINLNNENPVEALMDATLGIGVDAVIDAVGVDAQRPSSGPAAAKGEQRAEQAMTAYPIRQAMNKNLTIRAGNCDHRPVTPPLVDLVASGVFDPTAFITQHEPISDVVDAYLNFDRREEGWLKTVLTTA